ncbi:MAG: exodeoxyribonuclease VII small subunit [Patescibacteria group bacterium]
MPKKSDIDLTAGFEELEKIAAWFEKGETDLEEGVQKFERAMSIASALKKQLTSAENRVKEIKKKYDAP